jgi:HEAT repeat protein
MVVMRALDNEKDDDVRRAIYAALGQMATPEAVNLLISAATEGGGLFRRGVTPVRVAAVRALAEARTPEAIAAISSLTTDRDREVRESASRGLTSRTSGSESGKGPSLGW